MTKIQSRAMLLAGTLAAALAACESRSEASGNEQPRHAGEQTAPGVEPAKVPPPPGSNTSPDTSLHQPSAEAGTQPVDSAGKR